MASWAEVINKISEQERECNNKLAPSKYKLDNIVGCARTIHHDTQPEAPGFIHGEEGGFRRTPFLLLNDINIMY